jgi:hypothetical protein
MDVLGQISGDIMNSARDIPVGNEVVDDGDFDGVTPVSEDGWSCPSQHECSNQRHIKAAEQMSCIPRILPAADVLVNVLESWHGGMT